MHGDNDNNEVDSLLLEASQQYESNDVSSIGKQDDDKISEKDHQTRFGTPVTKLSKKS